MKLASGGAILAVTQARITMKKRNCRPRAGTRSSTWPLAGSTIAAPRTRYGFGGAGRRVAGRSCGLPFALVDRVAQRGRRPQQSLDQRGVKRGVAEFGLPEHAVAGAIGLGQQPDDANAVRRDQQLLGATVGKDVEMAGDDLCRETARLCGRCAPLPRREIPQPSAACGRDDRNWRRSSASPAASSCRRCLAPRPFR